MIWSRPLLNEQDTKDEQPGRPAMSPNHVGPRAASHHRNRPNWICFGLLVASSPAHCTAWQRPGLCQCCPSDLRRLLGGLRAAEFRFACVFGAAGRRHGLRHRRSVYPTLARPGPFSCIRVQPAMACQHTLQPPGFLDVSVRSRFFSKATEAEEQLLREVGSTAHV
jgi:hypothetical protein